MEGINANANAGDASRWDWVGSPISARLVQDRQMVIGRLTAQVGKSRFASTPNTSIAARARRSTSKPSGCHNRGDDWIGLGNNAAPFQSPEATSTAGTRLLRRAVLRESGVWTMPATNKLLLEAGLHGVPLQPDLRSSAAGRHHQPDPGDASSRTPSTPATGSALRAAAELHAIAASRSWGWAVGKTDGWRASASYVTGAHNMKVGYQGNRLDQLDQDDRERHAARLPVQPGRAECGELLSPRRSAAARSRACTRSSSRTAGRAAG